MPATQGTGSHRRGHFLVLAAYILGTFGYFLVLLILPFVVGPWALVPAIAIGAGIVWFGHRHVRTHGRKAHVDWSLGWKRSTREREPSLALEVTFTFALGIFIGLLIGFGLYLQIRYGGQATSEGALALVGGGLILFANYIALGLLAERDPRYALGVPLGGIPLYMDSEDE